MGLRHLFLLLFVFISSNARPSPLVWNCSLHATLRGDADFYLHYGRDSWHGTGALACYYKDQLTKKTVEIGFHGSDYGYGINQTSTLEIDTNVITSTPPLLLKIFGFVMNRTPGHGVVWRVESNANLCETTVMMDGEAGVERSLQRGTLFIR